MNLRLARQVLRSLKQSSETPLAIRLATRWIRAGMADDYDRLIRAGVLEGAAGVPEGSWMRQGARGLVKAQATFETASSMDPAWFSPSNSGVYRALLSGVKKNLSTMGIRSEVEDVLHAAIMGIGVHNQKVQAIPYAVGKYLSAGIKSGAETPDKVSALMSNFIKKKMLTELKAVGREQIVEPDETGLENEPVPSGTGEDFGDALMHLMFESPSDPLSRKIRSLMRAAWHDSPPMLLWLDTVENKRYIPSKLEIADALGIALTGLTANHWKPRWKKFFSALWSRQALVDSISERFESQGIDWDPASVATAEEMEALLPSRAKHGSDLLLRLFGRQQ